MHNIEAVRQLALDLEKRAKEIQGALDEETAAVRSERERWEREKEEMSSRFGITDNILELNVGGTHFTTYKSVLCKYEDSLLAAMFSGRHAIAKDSNGKYFIDCDAEAFRFILNYLRTDRFVFPDSPSSRQIFQTTLQYFALIPPYFVDSLILDDPQLITLLTPILPPCLNQELLYRASRDGWASSVFHQKCDAVTNTIVLVRVGKYIFGGFAPAAWGSPPNGYNPADQASFLFSLSNPTGTNLGVRFLNTGKQSSYSIYCNNGYGPTFGGGHDIHIASNANQNQSSYSNFGHSYSHPTFAYQSNDIKTFFCGSYNFQPTEIEVYALS